MKLIIAILLGLMPFVSLAESDKGNGGGGLCLPNGKCMMLAETGFRLSQPTNQVPEIDGRTIDELDKISSKLPGLGLNVENVIGQAGHVKIIEIEKDNKARRFVDQYRKAYLSLLKKSNSPIKGVEIFGFTRDFRTFLIKEKLQNLSPRSQALLLIHEMNLRKGASLEATLQFDSALVDALTSLDSGQRPNARPLILAARAVRLLEKLEAATYLIGEGVRQAGGIIDIKTLFGSGLMPTSTSPISETFEINYSQLLKARKVIPTLSTDIEADSRVYISWKHLVSRSVIMNDFANSLPIDNGRSTIVTQKVFDRFTADLSPLKKRLLKACDQAAPDAELLYAYDARDEEARYRSYSSPVFTSVGSFSCRDYVSGLTTSSEGGPATYSGPPAFTRATGLRLNLTCPVACKVSRSDVWQLSCAYVETSYSASCQGLY